MNLEEITAAMELDDRLTILGRCECGEVRDAPKIPLAEGGTSLDYRQLFCPAGCEIPA